jgi:hypothetical protein
MPMPLAEVKWCNLKFGEKNGGVSSDHEPEGDGRPRLRASFVTDGSVSSGFTRSLANFIVAEMQNAKKRGGKGPRRRKGARSMTKQPHKNKLSWSQA